MKIKLEQGKFVIEAEMDWQEFEKLLPVPAFLALEDLGTDCRVFVFFLKDGNLYCRPRIVGFGDNNFFDVSIQRWQKSDKP